MPDTVPPVISLIGSRKASNNQVQQGWPFVDPGAKASDNRDDSDELTAKIVVGGADLSNTMAPGTYKRTYNVEDEAGNKAKQKRRKIMVSWTQPGKKRRNGSTQVKKICVGLCLIRSRW